MGHLKKKVRRGLPVGVGGVDRCAEFSQRLYRFDLAYGSSHDHRGCPVAVGGVDRRAERSPSLDLGHIAFFGGGNYRYRSIAQGLPPCFASPVLRAADRQ